MKPHDVIVPFGVVSNRLEPLRSDVSELIGLFGDLPENDLKLLQELRLRESEVAAWFSADPQRVTLLKDDPRSALQDLLRHLRMDKREIQASRFEPPQGWRVDVLQVRKTEVGSQLLKAVWAYLNAAEKNLTSFNGDVFQAVDTVAALMGASAEERSAVVDALSTVMGISPPVSGSIVRVLQDRALVDELNLKIAAVFLHRK